MSDLKNYETYFANHSLIDQSLSKLKSDQNDTHSALKAELETALEQMKIDFKLINSFQSISKLAEAAEQKGWKNIYRISQEIKQVCESNVSKIPCFNKITYLQEFTANSNLNDNLKESILKEAEYYQLQQEAVLRYDSEYISRFDSLALSYNKLVTLSNPTTVTNKIEVTKEGTVKAFANKKAVVIEAQNLKNVGPLNQVINYAPQTGIVLLCCLVPIISFSVLNKFRKKFELKKNKETLVLFCREIFRKTDLKVRLFGKLEERVFKRFNPLFPKVYNIFNKPGKYFGELQFRFSTVGKLQRFEIRYVSNVPLYNFYQTSVNSGVMEYQAVVEQVEQTGGEVLFKTSYDKTGLVTFSNMTIEYPNS